MSYQYYCDMFFLMNGHYLDALVLVVLIQFNESFLTVSYRIRVLCVFHLSLNSLIWRVISNDWLLFDYTL